MRRFTTLAVRPYQLLCLICRAGGNTDGGAAVARLRVIMRAIARNPVTPVTLRCNVSSHYDYQNPGHDDDTPEGALFNARRDLSILQRLGLTPGETRPAYELLLRIYQDLPSVAGICGHADGGECWRGCPSAFSGCYERGIAAGLAALIPPRSEAEMAAVKVASAEEILAANRLDIRPHHLLCMACFHGGQQTLAPIAADNLQEAIVAVQRNPDLPITLRQGPCVICPPCPHFDAGTGRCIRNNAMALRDEKKDLDVLQRLGLEYGITLPARELFTRLFAAVASTTEICGNGDGVVRGWEWTICNGSEGSAGYPKARVAGLGIAGVEQR